MMIYSNIVKRKLTGLENVGFLIKLLVTTFLAHVCHLSSGKYQSSDAISS